MSKEEDFEKLHNVLSEAIHKLKILKEDHDAEVDRKMKLVCENITAMNGRDCGLSWKERYDYNMKMIKSLFT